ncbi:unnamed protein product, partial [Prorocentrum cordatum]
MSAQRVRSPAGARASLAQDTLRLEGVLWELKADLGESLRAQTAELRGQLEAQTELLLQALAPSRGAGQPAPPRCTASPTPAPATVEPDSPASSAGTGKRPASYGSASPRKVGHASSNAELFAVHFEQHWRACRTEMSTSARFNVREFLRTLVFESLPYFISGPLLVLAGDRDGARARYAWPYSVGKMWVDLNGTALFWLYFICQLLWYPLPDVNIWDATFLLLLMMCRSSTVSVKYALYGEKARERMRSAWYVKFKRILVSTMSGHILNFDGIQCVALLEQACLSQVRADCDLSTGTVRFFCKEDAERCAAVAAGLIQQVADVEAGMTGAGSPDDPRAGAPDGCTPPAAGPGCPAHCHFECLTEEARGILARCIPALLRARDDECQVSTFAYALYLLHASHSISQRTGQARWAPFFVVGSLIGWLPVVMRALLGEPAFGTSARANFLLGVHPVVYSFFASTLLYYAWAPCLFRYRQYRLEDLMLKSMLLPQDRQPVRIKWRRDTMKTPRLDMTVPDNVLGWAAVWRVLHGGGFHSAFQIRSNVYCMITFGAVIVGTTLQTVAFELNMDPFPLPSKVQAFVSLGLSAAFVSLHLLLAHFSNCLATELGAGLHSHRMNIAAIMKTEAVEDRQDELRTSFEYLDALEAETSAKACAHPVTVGFVKGDIVRLYTILTVFSVLLYTDLNRLRQMVDDASLPDREDAGELDEDILQQLVIYGFSREYAVKSLCNNKHNHATTSYHLIKEKLLRSAGQSEQDTTTAALADLEAAFDGGAEAGPCWPPPPPSPTEAQAVAALARGRLRSRSATPGGGAHRAGTSSTPRPPLSSSGGRGPPGAAEWCDEPAAPLTARARLQGAGPAAASGGGASGRARSARGAGGGGGVVMLGPGTFQVSCGSGIPPQGIVHEVVRALKARGLRCRQPSAFVVRCAAGGGVHLLAEVGQEDVGGGYALRLSRVSGDPRLYKD